LNNVTSATLWTVYIWGSEESEPQPNDTLWFNSNLLAEEASDGAGTDDQGRSWRGACFDLEKWDVTYSLDRDNVVLYERGEDNILCPVGAILIVQRRSEPPTTSRAALLGKQITPPESPAVTYNNILAPEWQSEVQMLTSVNPSNLNFSAQAGGSDTESLFVVNNGTEISNYKVYVDEDYVNWFDILPDNFNLSGSKKKEVTFRLKPPLSANGKYDFKTYIVASSPSFDFCVGSDIRVPVQATVSNSGYFYNLYGVLFCIFTRRCGGEGCAAL
jgi:hypothetical protein